MAWGELQRSRELVFFWGDVVLSFAFIGKYARERSLRALNWRGGKTGGL